VHNVTRAAQAMSASPDAMLALSTPTRWQTVMFDPLAYIHPARLALPAAFDAPAQRAAINRFLIARYRLDLPQLRQSRDRQTEAEKLLLKHWLHLPQIVFLLGCQRLRLALARRGALLNLPASARAFITLPLLPQGLQGDISLKGGDLKDSGMKDSGMRGNGMRPANTSAPDHAALLRHGVRQLQISLGSLPVLLAQRLPLLFGPEIEESATQDNDEAAAQATESACDPAHALTLRMAIQHVKRYPISAE
jgi:type III secretion system OrgA/MxiK family protein